MSFKLRFAPSPTGHLHVGNARTALVNFLYAKSNNGSLLLRIDDTDNERSKKEYEESIKNDLLWLGIKWDMMDRQSNRFENYTNAIKILEENDTKNFDRYIKNDLKKNYSGGEFTGDFVNFGVSNMIESQKKYLDECTLCDLCIDAAGAENIKIIKLY